MNIPYGYCIAPNGRMAVDQEKVVIVKMIYQQYLSGQSLGGIADFLFEHGVLSPRGKEGGLCGVGHHHGWPEGHPGGLDWGTREQQILA